MNEQWGEYLDLASTLKEGIHLRAIGGKDPAEEYNIECDEYYSAMSENVVSDMGEILLSVLENGIENVTLPKPSRTWTYLLADNADKLKRRTLAEYLLEDEENYVDEYSDEYDAVYGEEETQAEETVEKPKKGFFARLFGKK